MTGPDPTVSVLMPAYNCEPYVRTTLEAVLAQLPADGELVACDNASTDATYEILQSYASRDRRVRVYRNAENVGSIRNSNECLSRANAPWATFVCTDDVPAGRAIPALLAAARGAAGAGLVFGEYVAWDGAAAVPGFTEAAPPRCVAWPESFAMMVAVGNPVPFSTALFRVDLARAVGGLRPDRLFTADYRFWLAIAALAPICRVHGTTLYYRERAGSESDPQRRARAVSGMMDVHRAKLERWVALDPELRRAWEGMRREALVVYLRALWVSLVGESDPSGIGREIRALAAELGPAPVRSVALAATRAAAAAVRIARRARGRAA